MCSIKLLIVYLAISNFTISQTVIIGSQVWSTKNLNVTTFRNGDQIPEAKTLSDWYNAELNKQPVWCYYDNDPGNGEIYGKLYNWYAVNDSRGLAPQGFHIPSETEWLNLLSFLGAETAAKKLKSKIGWDKRGVDIYGFNALPGGKCNAFNSFGIDVNGDFWTSTEIDDIEAVNFNFNFWYDNVSSSRGTGLGFKGEGCSVRCIKD